MNLGVGGLQWTYVSLWGTATRATGTKGYEKLQSFGPPRRSASLATEVNVTPSGPDYDTVYRNPMQRKQGGVVVLRQTGPQLMSPAHKTGAFDRFPALDGTKAWGPARQSVF
ncbi:hypothetical protein JTE90_003518 [Oedothorax gibbosus]|uniref:Uncharacterized protein n=1 Tax=Oedothorax gibbosus TaxID=931172 RepID=A0AAV6TMU1_9ARAC|nr:hypothetical protein JTE90_003518 [Oedothorax gibbosus]